MTKAERMACSPGMARLLRTLPVPPLRWADAPARAKRAQRRHVSRMTKGRAVA